MFREKNGKVSYIRVSGFITLVFYLIWGSYLVFINKTIADLPVGLLTLLLGLYGLNRLPDMLEKIKGGGL